MGGSEPKDFEGKDTKKVSANCADFSTVKAYSPDKRITYYICRVIPAPLKRVIDWYIADLSISGYGEYTIESNSSNVETGPRLRDFDIEESKGNQSNRLIKAGDVKAWKQVSTEKTRGCLTRWVMSLFTIWLITGLIAFTVTGNPWLLVTLGILAPPIHWIFRYYYRRPKK